MTFDPFLDSDALLSPKSAVAAIVRVDGSKYLLQHRDPKPEIFFPDHWTFFGGEVESGETHEEAMQRELREELGLHFEPDAFSYFTTFDFDLAFAGGKTINRVFYEIDVPSEKLEVIRQGEGQGMEVVTGRKALAEFRMAPYDSFALWMHLNQARLKP